VKIGLYPLQGHYLIPNIKENPRNRKDTKRGRKRLFNEAIHALRRRVERTFAWEDKFKRLLLRFERIQQRHYGLKLMAYTLINLRAFCSASNAQPVNPETRHWERRPGAESRTCSVCAVVRGMRRSCLQMSCNFLFA
jgi:hypothetical protein